MIGYLALYLIALLVGCGASLWLNVVAFAGISVLFGMFVMVIALAHIPLPLGLVGAFTSWILLHVSYVVFGAFHHFLNRRLDAKTSAVENQAVIGD